VQQATLPQQRVVTATLDDLPKKVAEAGLRPPTLVIVGDVVRLREKLAWFEPAVPANSEEVGASPRDPGSVHAP
jgi:uroporphyrin-III C-methyltransferase/precorrin-2 dehydrogenase/sirohydrochlorin ferrochelatase